jgi:hypothetical protein
MAEDDRLSTSPIKTTDFPADRLEQLLVVLLGPFRMALARH